MNWCRTRRGIAGVLLVIATAMFLGYYGWLALAAPPFPSYRLDFAGAEWIRAAEDGPDTYFRKKFYIGGRIEQAWIQVAASDNFRLFINEIEIHNAGNPGSGTWTASAMSAEPSIILDISKYLKIGTNAISINVLRATYPGAAKVKVRGAIRQTTSQQEFVSDGTWKASGFSGVVANLVPWTSPLLDDNLWPRAETLTDESSDERLIQPVPGPPALLQLPFRGVWIGDGQSARAQINFTKHFDVSPGTETTWLQVASTGNYTVTLNGHWLGDYHAISPSIQLFYIQRWIKGTGNDLVIQTRSPGHQPLLIAEVSCLAAHNKVLSTLGTGSDWTVSGVESEANFAGLHNAQEMGQVNYTGDRWGVPPRENTVAELSSTERTRQTLFGFLVMAVTVFGVFLLWLCLARLLVRARNFSADDALSLDAALHLPVLLLVAVLLLLRYEIRLLPESVIRAEFFFGLLALLIGLRLVVWLSPRSKRVESETDLNQSTSRPAGFFSRFLQERGFGIALGLIVIFAFGLRVAAINTFPLDQDDIFIRSCTKGIFLRGYPSIDYGGVPIRLTTYELVPYPIALSTLFFGWSDWVIRVPALVFGTLTALVLGRMGRSLYGRRVGLLAALIYAFLPWNVFWSLHCFHPQQAQFFGLLCMWSFYAAIREPDGLDKKYFYRSCFFFCLTYLSWEGTGFLLPVFALALLLMHPGRWGWLRKFHLWAGLFAIGAVVVMQLASRYMSLPPYLALGYGLADLGTPELYFLDPQCQPFFYLTSVFLTDPHFLLTLCFCLGLLFVGKSGPTRYCLIVFLGLLLSYSLLLPAYSQRYCYFYQTLLILGACGTVFQLSDRIFGLSRGLRWPLGDTLIRLCTGLALVLLFISTTNWGLRLYRLSEGRLGQTGLRYGLRWQDSASSARFVDSQLQSGDIVIADLTQAFELYGGKLPDYGTDTLLGSRIVYNRNRPVPRYEHRITSIPIIHNVQQVQEILQKARRIWYVTTFEPNSTSPMQNNAADLLTRNSRVVYTCYSSIVYLWEGFTMVPEKIIPNLALPPHPTLPAEFDSLVKTALDPANPPAAQLPFARPLRPEAAFDEGSGRYQPQEPPAPDGTLLPSAKSLEPRLRPTPIAH